jgi:5'-3' exonuclease
MMKQIVLVDGKNLVFRVHYVHRLLASKDGKPTSVLYGVLSSMLNMASRLPEANWAFVWDGVGKTWRHDLLDEEVMPTETRQVRPVVRTGDHRAEKTSGDWFVQQLQTSVKFIGREPLSKKPVPQVRNYPRPQKPQGYKANRGDLHNSDDHQIALQQIPELKKVLTNIGIRQFEVPNLEGDDLMGIMVHQLRGEYDDVIIHSGDRDFYQFIGEGVRQLKGIRDGELRWASAEEIWNEFRVPVEDWVKLKALIGDSSDNIPHLFDRVGQVTAAKWLQEGLDPSLKEFSSHRASVQQKFSSIVVRKNLIELQARWQEVYRNYRLCKIITDPTAEEVKHCQPELSKQVLGPWSGGQLKRKPIQGMFMWLTEWLHRYDMAELYGRRDEFIRIP